MPGKRDPRGKWWEWSGGCDPMEVLSPEEGYTETVLEYVWKLPRGEASFVTVIVPEQFERPSLAAALAHRSAFSLKLRLLAEPGVAIADIPVVSGTTTAPKRVVCRVLVSGVHGATLRALNDVRTLGFDDARAVFFAFDPEEARALHREWKRQRVDFPLEVVEAPFRDLGEPLLAHLREITCDPTRLPWS